MVKKGVTNFESRSIVTNFWTRLRVDFWTGVRSGVLFWVFQIPARSLHSLSRRDQYQAKSVLIMCQQFKLFLGRFLPQRINDLGNYHSVQSFILLI